MSKRIAALDIGGTRIKACLFDNERVLFRAEADTPATLGPDSVLNTAAALIEKWLPFDAVGISTAGQVDVSTGIIRYANENLPSYTGTDVKSYFETHFSKPTAVLNDVYAAALGEGVCGAARGKTDYLCITYGTGIGGGIILGGKPYYGMGPSANCMIGGLILRLDDWNTSDPFSGTYERLASATALRELAMTVDPSLNNGRIIFERLAEPAVQAVVDVWLDRVAAGLCSLIHLFNTPCIILGGGVMEQSYAINGARVRVKNRIIPGFSGVQIAGAALGNMAGLYGACAWVEKCGGVYL